MKLRSEYIVSNKITNNELAERYHIQKESVNVWLRGTHLPPLHVLLDMAKEFNTNISYLLCLTDYDLPMDCCEINLQLGSILEEQKMHRIDLFKRSGVSLTTIRRYERGTAEKPNLTVLETIANNLGVSIEYLMGLSRHRTWETAAIIQNPFLQLKANAAVCLQDREGKKKLYLVTEERKLIDANGRIYTQQMLQKQGVTVKEVFEV